MLERIKENLEKTSISSKTKVLLAISGGVDSVVLCDVLLKLNIPFALAHCNFGLREKNSEQDQELVMSIAEKFDVQLHLIRFNTKEEANERNLSIQLVARELRYDWFSDLQKEFNYANVLTGHHLNDRVETTLINLTRGTGLSGLRSIKLENNTVVRPLYTNTKEELYAYAKANQLNWREDKSNTDNKYTRNLIRNVVVPTLEKVNPSFVTNAKNTLDRLSDTELIYEEAINAKKLLVKTDDVIDVKVLKSQVGAKQLLYEIIKEYGFGYTQAVQVFNALENISGKVFYSDNFQLVIDREKIFIQEIKELDITTMKFDWRNEPSISFNNIELIFSKTGMPSTLKTPTHIINISLGKISRELELRKWQLGDKMKPFGMKGRQKKISDILIDKKVPLHKKEDVNVLVANGEIVWLLGYCVSETFAIKQLDKEVCQVKMVEK